MSFKFLSALLVVCLFHSIKTDKINFKDCGSSTGVIEYVDIQGCTATPCTFIKGQSAAMTLRFKTNVSTNTLTNKCFGIILGIPVPFPLPEPSACNMGASCPVSAGDFNTIQISLPILKEYPSIGVDVKWQVVDQNNKNVACFQFPVKLTV